MIGNFARGWLGFWSEFVGHESWLRLLGFVAALLVADTIGAVLRWLVAVVALAAFDVPAWWWEA